MFKNEYVLTVDLKKKMTMVTPTFVQYDSAILTFKIFDDGKPFDLTGFTKAEVSHRKLDGTVVIGEAVIEGAGTNRIIKYTYKGNEMNKAGYVETSLSVHSDNKKVSIQPFKVNIIADLAELYATPANPEFGALQSLIATVEALKKSIIADTNEAAAQAAHAKTQGDYAKTQGSYAKLQGDSVASSVIAADSAATRAKSSADSADTASLNANAKALLADEKATHANTQAEYAKLEGDRAKAETIDLSLLKTNVTNATADSVKVKDETILVKNATESERVATELVRLSTEEERDNTEIVRLSTDAIRLATELERQNTETVRLATIIAKDGAITASEGVTDSIQNAIDATLGATTATTNADVATLNANQSALDADEKANLAQLASENANAKALLADEKAQLANDKAVLANTATTVANTKIGEMNALLPLIDGLENKGEYDSLTYYKINNTVRYNGSSYQAIADSSDILPTDNTYWSLLAQRGVDGTGSVVSVNGMNPDIDGNVQIAFPEGHTHTNKSVLDRLTDNTGQLQYNGTDVGSVTSVNGQIGAVIGLATELQLANKVDKIAGKQLSTEDYSAVDKTKLAGIDAGANKYVHPTSHPASMILEDSNRRFVSDVKLTELNAKETIVGAQAKVDVLANRRDNPNAVTKAQVGLSNVDNVKQATKVEFDAHSTDTTTHITGAERTSWNAKETVIGSQSKADTAEGNAKTYADTKIAGIVNTAPEALDTLNELATALGNDPNFATTVATQIGTKVDKVAGKGLSTEDFTSTEKTKLAGIEVDAQKNTVTSVAGRTGVVTLTGTDIPASTASVRGTVQLSTSITSTSTTLAATPSAVKTAMDKANAAETPTGAQAKVDALAGAGNVSTVKQVDDKIGVLSDNVGAHKAVIASPTVLGHVKVGANLSIDAGGVLSASGGSTVKVYTGSLNNLVESGYYYAENGTVVKNFPFNMPANVGEALIEVSSTPNGEVFQTLTQMDGGTRVDTRQKYLGTWQSWKRVNIPLNNTVTSISTEEAATANVVRQVNDKIPVLNNTLTSTSTTQAATANAVKQVNDKLIGTNLVLGEASIAGTSFSNSIGASAKAGSFSTSVGAFSQSGADAVAIGHNAKATGANSVAIGEGSSSLNINEGVLGVANSFTNIWKVPGAFSVAGTKQFQMPHPHPEKKDTHVLRHSAVESPTAGDNLYRYTVDASFDGETVELQLPDYFQYLNKDVDVYVNGDGHFGNAFGSVAGDILKVTCQLAGSYKVLIIGTRNDDHQSVQNWGIKGAEKEIGESWDGETYVFEDEEIITQNEYLEVIL